MTAYTYDVPVTSPVLELGDDVYAKPVPIDSDWATDMVSAEPEVGYPTWYLLAAGLDYSDAYIVFRNTHLATVTAYDGTDTLTVASHGITAAGRIYFRGSNMPANIVVGKPYYLVAVDANSFQISLTSGGAPVSPLGSLTGDPSMYVTATEKRSASDEQIGTLPADEAVLVAEGQESRSDAQFTNILNLVQPSAMRSALGLEAADVDDQLDALALQISGIDTDVTSLIGSITGGVQGVSITQDSIVASVGSTKQVSVSTSEDVTAKTLAVVFETIDGTADVATIANGSISRTVATAIFNLPSAVTASERTLRYSVKDATTAELYSSGLCFVTYAATGDA